MLIPTSAQVKDVTLIESVIAEQLSDDPLSTSAATMLALLLRSNWMVMFCAIAIGEVVSSTVTVAGAVSKFPPPSVTVSITALAPTSLQLKVLLFRLKEATPQSTEEPLSTSEGAIVTLPKASK